MRAALGDRLHARLGAGVFREAVEDVARGRIRRSRLSALALLLALAVLASPFVTLAAGVWLIAFDFPNLLTIALGAALVWAGWTLVPRRDRAPPGLLTRADLPAIFALLDRIAAALGAETPEALTLTPGFNASMRRTVLSLRRQSELEIGLTLWAALDCDERVALLAHEIAHAHHGDSARVTPVALALDVLDGWAGLWSPSRLVDDWGWKRDYGEGPGSALGAAIAAVLVAVADGLSYAIARMEFLDCQRAEYLADAASVRVAGATPVLRLLEKVSLRELVACEVARLGDGAKHQGAAVFDALAAPAWARDTDEARRELERMQSENLRLDRTHPPTRFRIGFVEVLGPVEAAVALTAEEADAIDRELAPHAEALASRLFAALERQ